MSKLSPRQEAFAQAIASGMSQLTAYEKAGYKPSEQHASRLARNGKVMARVAELQRSLAKKADITRESLLAELEEARIGAMADEQYAAAVSATMSKAKLTGHIIDQRRLTGPNGGPIEINLTGFSDDQLRSIEAALAPFAGATSDPAEGYSG